MKQTKRTNTIVQAAKASKYFARTQEVQETIAAIHQNGNGAEQDALQVVLDIGHLIAEASAQARGNGGHGVAKTYTNNGGRNRSVIVSGESVYYAPSGGFDRELQESTGGRVRKLLHLAGPRDTETEKEYAPGTLVF